MAFIVLIIFSIQIFIPETPVYLIGKNKIEPAHKILRILRGKRWDVTEELTNIKIASESEVKHRVTKRHLVVGSNPCTLMELIYHSMAEKKSNE